MESVLHGDSGCSAPSGLGSFRRVRVPRAALCGFAASLCPGLSCRAPSARESLFRPEGAFPCQPRTERSAALGRGPPFSIALKGHDKASQTCGGNRCRMAIRDVAPLQGLGRFGACVSPGRRFAASPLRSAPGYPVVPLRRVNPCFAPRGHSHASPGQSAAPPWVA